MWEGILHSVACVCRGSSKAACSVKGGWQEPESDVTVKEDMSKLSFPGYQHLAMIVMFRRQAYKFTKNL